MKAAIPMLAALIAASAGHTLAATLTVDDDHLQCPSATFSSIQAAVTAARPGDTINVCPGVYDEQVNIDKKLTVQGIAVANMNQAIIKPNGTVPNSTSAYSGNPITAIVVVHDADGVNLTNLTVDGSTNGIAGCAPDLVGVFYRNASGTIDELAVRDIRLGGSLGGCQSGDGIFVQSGGGGKSKVTVSNTSVHDYQKTGIVANEVGTDVMIKGNAITGIGPTPDIAQNGIQIGFGAKGTVDGNAVINNVYSLCVSVDDCGAAASNILVDTADNVKVTRNTTGNANVNIGVYANNADVNNNTILQSEVFDGIDLIGNNNRAVNNTIFYSDDAGVYVQGNNNQVTANTINEATEGVLIDQPSSGTMVNGNKFYNTLTNAMTVPASTTTATSALTKSASVVTKRGSGATQR